jgi:hypothetical protein
MTGYTLTPATFYGEAPHVQVTHEGPEGKICCDGYVYKDRVQGSLPHEVVREALELLTP